uniref:Uncharacterized protein n=1 Tax=Anguilla anguilla TaxID=7936 RepID=A0A0E9QXT5_ANGAN
MHSSSFKCIIYHTLSYRRQAFLNLACLH